MQVSRDCSNTCRSAATILSMKYRTEQWLVGTVLTVLAAAVLWWLFAPDKSPSPDAISEQPATVLPEQRPRMPQYPVRAPIEIAESDSEALLPLPPLSDSDQYFKIELVNLYGKALAEMLADEALIEKFVATVDNLPRGRVAERIRPVKGLPDTFVAEPGTVDDSWVLGAENYARYAALVNMLVHADTTMTVNTYRRYYPLMQEAYVGLGYPDGYFNDRVIEVIDHLLATPQVPDRPALVRPHVLYEYEDAALESLSSGQKLLIRMGPQNATAVQQALRAVREQLVTAAATDSDAD